MARKAREKSKSMFYHIILKGISSQVIFKDEEDRTVCIEKLRSCKEIMEFEIHGYCLMDNHVHIIIKDVKREIAKIMKSFCVSYARYFNQKYERSGPLFNDRYKSEVIEDDTYYKTVQRYIHQNPLKAGIDETSSYKWSSYKEFVKARTFVTTDYLLDLIGSKKRFKKYINEENQDTCLEVKAEKVTDKTAKNYIIVTMNIENIEEVKKLDKEDKDKLISKCLEMNISERQISRLTKMSRGMIRKVKK